MELLIFDVAEGAPAPKGKYGPLTLGTKGLTFKRDFAEKFNLDAHNIVLGQDKAKPLDWYFKLVPAEEKGMPVYKHGVGMRTCGCPVEVIKILKSQKLEPDFDANKYQVPFSPEPNADGWFAIITKGLQIIAKK